MPDFGKLLPVRRSRLVAKWSLTRRGARPPFPCDRVVSHRALVGVEVASHVLVVAEDHILDLEDREVANAACRDHGFDLRPHPLMQFQVLVTFGWHQPRGHSEPLHCSETLRACAVMARPRLSASLPRGPP